MDEYRLTEGAEIKVLTIGRRDSFMEYRGRFAGYASVGGAPGLVISTDEGRTIVSIHMIVSILILKDGTGSEDDGTPEHLYG